MIALSRAGLRVTATAADLDRLASIFATTHLVRLPGFIDEELGALIARRLDRAAFTPRLDGDLIIEYTLADADLLGLCVFVLNDARLFEVIDRITHCGPFASFSGRVYRRGEPTKPGEQYYAWHDDVSENRRVALSVNLGRLPYQGGTVQLRDASTYAPLAEAREISYLDALLIRVDPALQHRVAPVEGDVSRTVLAGWFRGPAAPTHSSLQHPNQSAI